MELSSGTHSAALVSSGPSPSDAAHHHGGAPSSASKSPPRKVAVRMVVIFAVLTAGWLAALIAPIVLRVGTYQAWIVCVWPALSNCLFLISYAVPSLRLGVRLLHKHPGSGTIALPRLLLCLPALLPLWVFWWARHVLVQDWKEEPFHKVSQTLYLGRFPLRYPSEFPIDVANIVDLTAEFVVRKDVASGRRYICLPSLDCELPGAHDMVSLARDVATWPGDTYIHCANGHGRSASVAALVMVLKGEAASVDAAFATMKSTRTLVGIQPQQRAVLMQAEAMLHVAHGPSNGASASTSAGAGAVPSPGPLSPQLV